MEIIGIVNRVRWRSDGGWSVVDFVDETNMRFVGVGVMPNISDGERLELIGEWSIHKTYGKQFSISSYKSVLPSNTEGIIKYLSSGLIRGVGESTAKAIVGKFGTEALTVIEKSPEKLKQISGIGKVKAQMIHESFMEQIGLQAIIMGLQELGISVKQAVKVYKLYGDNCVKIIRENPYKLIEDVEAIGFKTADKIAASAGVEPDSPFRIKAGIRHTLNLARADGNTCLPKDILIMRAANNVLGVEIAMVENILEEMIVSSEVVEKLIEDNEMVFLSYLHYLEMDSAVRLMNIKSGVDLLPMLDIEGEISGLERKFGIELAEKQREAVTLALTEGVVVITGGPGTGKTTILRFIIELMERLDLTLELAAPTGRAAKRISDTTGREARTIHRLLEYGYGADEFSRNDDYPIEADAIIVDEMSMVDISLFHALLKAIAEGTRIIMVGDFDQLPPVGAGNVLRDIVTAEAVPVMRLTDIYRQAGRSMIVTNAHRINRGMMPLLRTEECDFTFVPCEGMNDTLSTVVEMCKYYAGIGGENELQVLSPMKQNTLGVLNLNEKLQTALNPPADDKREYKYGETVFRIGDRVMQVKNDYRLEWKKYRLGNLIEEGAGVFNGDIGTVMGIDGNKSIISVLFDDERTVEYSTAELEELELAYCVTVHKSQGSEFSIVILPLIYGPPMLMSRNILYTAVTRARNKVYIVGTAKCVESMVVNGYTAMRYSALGYFLKQLSE